MKHDKVTVLWPNGKRFQVSKRKLSPADGGTAKPGQVAVAIAGLVKKPAHITKPKRALFEGKSQSHEYAMQLATSKLGHIVGNSSDGSVCYAKAGWCQLEWVEKYSEARCHGLPTVSLPRAFRIIATKKP